jgi:hypothetical protein
VLGHAAADATGRSRNHRHLAVEVQTSPPAPLRPAERGVPFGAQYSDWECRRSSE